MSDILISIGVEPDLAGHKENARRQINTRQEAMDSLLSIAGRLLIRENEPYMVRDGCLIHRALEILKEGEPTSTVKIETIDEVKARFDRKLAPFLPPPGNAHDRWMVETPEYKADASSVVGTMIGGRLDWIEFGTAAERLLPQLLAEPIPYPPI